MAGKNSSPPKKSQEVIKEAEKAVAKASEKLNVLTRWPLHKKKEEGPVRYASFNDRVFASVIDTALSFIVLAPLLMGLSQFIYGNKQNPFTAFPQGTPPEIVMEEVMRSGYINNLFIDYTVHFVIFGAIILWLWNKSSATPGKWALKMRIVDKDTFCKPSPKKLLIRYCSYLVSLLPFTAGFAWVMFDKQRRGWHDMLAGTVVVKVDHWRFKDDGLTPHVILPPPPEEHKGE